MDRVGFGHIRAGLLPPPARVDRKFGSLVNTMSKFRLLNSFRADRLHNAAQALQDAGDEDGALAKYAEALTLDPERPGTLYNIGLIHKYRNDWLASFKFNERARRLRPDDEATNWNLAIAATALRDWRAARDVWHGLGMNIESGSDPIEANFGLTPVRLNPDDGGEVVWATRIDPVRARIDNIPLPESGYRWLDVVLHDGAAVGHRLNRDCQERPVFNVLELFEPSGFSTFEAEIVAPGSDDVAALEAAVDTAGGQFEDWTDDVRHLCKACSEGTPHERHDTAGGTTNAWSPERRTGIAIGEFEAVDRILAAWASDSRRVTTMRLALEAKR